ncbi:hypothetical protein EQZ23_11605 [Sphingomonas sp. UV9]|uniref:hypothetical protein n=1 Tax=Sphingomonas sp. UV9 TaxID=1851410 RepID=UPI000FFC03AA|nr:hypothetical protein [Sphingomonas sp. UV9]RXD05681.1 hypothetical protein EQZ23_11605 [Sphingomonas sp. UV9]
MKADIEVTRTEEEKKSKSARATKVQPVSLALRDLMSAPLRDLVRSKSVVEVRGFDHVRRLVERNQYSCARRDRSARLQKVAGARWLPDEPSFARASFLRGRVVGWTRCQLLRNRRRGLEHQIG